MISTPAEPGFHRADWSRWAIGFLAAAMASRGHHSRKSGPAATSSEKTAAAAAELDAIANYARFVAAHPDMPAAHRRKCLDAIVANARRLRDAPL